MSDESIPELSSPPCFAHELSETPFRWTTYEREASAAVARWRKQERARLIADRLTVPAAERRVCAESVSDRLDALLARHDHQALTVSLYWPFKGELNLRAWMHKLHERGTRVALPVVQARDQPLVFRQWKPDARLQPGIWNIPVPVDGALLDPDVVIAPLVGFDGRGYRLGYGGGFFDRTLADMKQRVLDPVFIGVAHSSARIPTIYPQSHDIPMHCVVTEKDRFDHV